MRSIKVRGTHQLLCQHVRQTLRTGVNVCIWLGLATTGYAQNTAAVAVDENPSALFANETDQQIGLLLQRWPQLDAIQRRDLLAEVRKRMHLAKKAEASANSSNLQNHPPSLTLRIKRAQTQHSYGRESNRLSGSLNDQAVGQPQNPSANRDAPREMVIRTTVTQILPDGRRLVREQTLLPGAQPYRSSVRSTASASAVGNAQEGESKHASDVAKAPPSKVRVITTTVRFGAGFDQRSRRATYAERPKDGVRRVSTPQRETLEQRTQGIEQ